MQIKQAVTVWAAGLAPLIASARSHIPVTGASIDSESNDVPMRMNINDLYAKKGPQWELYLLALKSLQLKDAHDPLSYFQIAGIHGAPWIEWNNAGPERATGWQGYCPHGENIFLSWHRPFVLLFEQALIEEAKRIAKKYPDDHRTEYMQAAETLRSPYWDWSADSDVPPCTVPRRLDIHVPNGNQLRHVSIDNPLHKYDYPEAAMRGEFGWTPSTSSTTRCPAPDRYPDSANSRLAQRGLRQNTYDAFTYSQNFDEFATTRQNGMGLEEMHNLIHWDAGCEGQFLDLTTSGFDPLFMLHHTHVDRLWTYWQFINPSEAIFKSPYYGQSRFSTPEGAVITPDSPLEPFYDANKTQWTSNKIVGIEGLGYTYQGLEYWRKPGEQLQQDAVRLMNSLYAPEWASSWGKRTVKATKRYFARVELDRKQVERPCSVHVFMNGKAAGSVVVMKFPEAGILHGSVALDDQMMNAFEQVPTSNGTMRSVEHLFTMEIRKPDGTMIPLDSVKSLKLTLEEVSVKPAKTDAEFPKPGESKKHVVGVVGRQRPTTTGNLTQ